MKRVTTAKPFLETWQRWTWMKNPWQILDLHCFFLHILQEKITSDGMTIQDPESPREKARSLLSLLGQLFNGQFAQLVLGGQFSGGCLPR